MISASQVTLFLYCLNVHEGLNFPHRKLNLASNDSLEVCNSCQFSDNLSQPKLGIYWHLSN